MLNQLTVLQRTEHSKKLFTHHCDDSVCLEDGSIVLAVDDVTRSARRNDPALAASELAILNEKVTLATGQSSSLC